MATLSEIKATPFSVSLYLTNQENTEWMMHFRPSQKPGFITLEYYSQKNGKSSVLHPAKSVRFHADNFCKNFMDVLIFKEPKEWKTSTYHIALSSGIDDSVGIKYVVYSQDSAPGYSLQVKNTHETCKKFIEMYQQTKKLEKRR